MMHTCFDLCIGPYRPVHEAVGVRGIVVSNSEKDSPLPKVGGMIDSRQPRPLPLHSFLFWCMELSFE